MSPRCERCDREECKLPTLEHHPDCVCDLEGMEDESGCPIPAALADCRAHAVDWRARALAAEQERDVLHERLRTRDSEWEEYRYEMWAEIDRLWRLAWAAGWAAVGVAVEDDAQFVNLGITSRTKVVLDRLRADRNRLWRLAWAAGWAAVGMAVIIWQWAEYRFACSDTPGATRRLDAMLDALDAATMGTIRNAIDAAHGKET